MFFGNNGQPPFFYDYMNTMDSIIMESTMKVSNAPISFFFKRYLLQRAMSVFKWTLPKNWSKKYFLYVLYCYGNVGILRTDKFGVIPQMCTLSGYDVYYQPSHILVANPLLRGEKRLRIGSQCTLLTMTNDYGSLMDLVGVFGDLLALCIETGSTNISNSRLSYVFGAGNKAMANSFKSMLDDVLSGKPGVVYDKELNKEDGTANWAPFVQNVGQNFIAGDVLDVWRDLTNIFDSFIGLPSANTEKKERLITDEVQVNQAETETLVDMWYENWKDVIKESKALFGNLDWDVEWRRKPVQAQGQGGVADAGSVN